MKATHNGQCQICGRLQALPGGRLAKHGYTVDYGFFNGICAGTGHLPFEQDISLIEGIIAQVSAQAAALRAEAAARETATDPADVYYNDYGPYGHRGKDCYHVVRGRVEMTEGTYQRAAFVHEYQGKRRVHDNIAGGYTIAALVKQLNEQHAWRLNGAAKQAEEYVRWQQSRIKNWQPQPLTPREQ